MHRDHTMGISRLVAVFASRRRHLRLGCREYSTYREAFTRRKTTLANILERGNYLAEYAIYFGLGIRPRNIAI